jgi:hypothetical protein
VLIKNTFHHPDNSGIAPFSTMLKLAHSEMVDIINLSYNLQRVPERSVGIDNLVS